MKYTVLWKFELALYLDNTKKWSGWSFRTRIVLNGIVGEDVKKDLDDLVDRFDHSTLIYSNSEHLEYVKEESERHIIVNTPITDSTVAEIIFQEVNLYLLENKLNINCLEVISTIDFQDYEVSISENTNVLSVEYSEATFKS